MTATVIAPAKLTVSLRIVGIRPDGFHLIEAEMVTVSLADELTFCDAPQSSVRTTFDRVPTGLPISDGPDNLVMRALACVGRTARVEVRKRIPAGAGLGGGSADAAAVFRWAGRTSAADLLESATLGADVAFCIRGGRAQVSGIGEVLTPVPPLTRAFTLLIPPFGVSTPHVYRAWDELGGPSGPNGNDLEPAAIAVEPRLAKWRNLLAATTGQTPCLAGSGASWFVEGSFPAPAHLVVTTTD